MFINELQLYISFLNDKIETFLNQKSEKEKKYLMEFGRNLLNGIQYYKALYGKGNDGLANGNLDISIELEKGREYLELIVSKMKDVSIYERQN
ncbi:MAG: hypothetical protein ACJA01_002765 [Saprospiraceae bacterium]|jgi:hypothetical protein